MKKLRYTLMRTITMFLLGVAMVLSLNSCDDRPCQQASLIEEAIQNKIKAVNDLDFIDGVWSALGLSAEVQDKYNDLGQELERYRAHLLACGNSNCKRNAAEIMPELDKFIKEMKDTVKYTDLSAWLWRVIATFAS